MTTPFEGVPREILDRERALRELAALVDEARSRGDAAVFRVSGPPGIGKTTFLGLVAAGYAATRAIVSVRAEPSARARPGSVAEALSARPEALERAGSPLRDRLRAAIPPNALLCVDDVQWLDEGSERLIRRLIHERRDDLIVLFADRRDQAPELIRHRTIYLAPLRTTAASRLVRSVYHDATDDVVREIVATAAGLPFSLAFLAFEAARGGARRADEVDPSVAAAISGRLERCGPVAREVVQHCSLLGPSADLRTVARALSASIDTTAHALTELADIVTVARMQVDFKHASIATHIRLGISDPVPYFQRLLRGHDLGDDRPENLAAIVHCARGCGDDGTAASSARRVAGLLAAHGSLVTALEYSIIALRHAPRPLPAAYALDYAGLLLLLARDDEAAEFLRVEIRSAIERGDAYAAADLVGAYSSASVSLERFSELDVLCERVSALALERAPDALPAVRTAQLGGYAFSGRLEAFANLAAIGPQQWSVDRLTAFVESLSGNVEIAREAFGRYQAQLRPHHARYTPSDQALSATMGLFSIGNAALADVDDAWGSDGDPGTYATGTALRILFRLNAGRWSEADAVVAQLPLDDDSYQEPYPVLDARLLFTALARRTPVAADRTLSMIRGMIARGRVRHAFPSAAWYSIAAGRARIGVPADIESFIAGAIDAPPIPYLVGAIPLAKALLASELGAERCRASIEGGRCFHSAWHRAHDDLALGLVAQDHDRLRQARDAFDRLGSPVFAMFAGLALPVPRASDVALARALAVDPNRDESQSSRLRLTRREREVAELAAQAMTNREIAVRLVISERTVEVHLTNVFRKLAVRSRSGLAQVLLGNRRREA